VGGFDENSVGTTIVSSNGNSFVQEAMKMLNTDGFVVAASGNMEVDVQQRADGFENAFEGAAVVDND
jgi:hypothetical protein